jgi:hypothetical protein
LRASIAFVVHNDAADFVGEPQKRGEVLPGVLPGRHDRREPLTPLGLERLERSPRLVLIGGGVDRLEVLGDLLQFVRGT